MGIEYRKKMNFTFDNAQFSEDQATVTIKFEDGSTLPSHIEHALGKRMRRLRGLGI